MSGPIVGAGPQGGLGPGTDDGPGIVPALVRDRS
jgi:hypothetical protein